MKRSDYHYTGNSKHVCQCPEYPAQCRRTGKFKAAIKPRMDVLEYLVFNCTMDYRKTFVVTLDTKDTLYLKELIMTNSVVHPDDSVIAERILNYINTHY
jgi:hypothetical protein